jgi:hypothetical protein
MTSGTYVVIFVSSRSNEDHEGYATMANHMERLARATRIHRNAERS